MNAPFVLSPAVLDLDHARDLRSGAIRRAAVARKVNHNSHLIFTKLADGTRKVEYPVFKTGGWHSVEIIPVGIGRYAIVRNGKHQGVFETVELYPALRDFRQSAAFHMDMWRRLEEAYS